MNSGQFKLKYTVNENAFDGKTSLSQWALGLMASDGNVQNGKTVRISQSEINYDLLEFLKTYLEHNGEPYHNKKLNYRLLTWTNKSHINQLEKYGIVENKSLIYKLPNKDLLTYDFLRGYIDGDGCVGVYNNGKGIYYLIISWVGTKEFIDQCYKFLNNRGIVRKLKNVYEIKFNGKKAIEIGKLIYYNSELFPTRKYNLFWSYINDRKN